jgi:RiboL-PSP-HEPN
VPSNAFDTTFFNLMKDAELTKTKLLLMTSTEDEAFAEVLRRSIVISVVSAWESYVEELVREAIELLKPVGSVLGVWSSFKAASLIHVGRFNTPNTDQVRNLFAETLGLQDIQKTWTWPGVTAKQSREELQQVMELRHMVAHGTNPRPVVNMAYSTSLVDFFSQLAKATDDATRAFLVSCGVAEPWPII